MADGILTPAQSVLGAIQGLDISYPQPTRVNVLSRSQCCQGRHWQRNCNQRFLRHSCSSISHPTSWDHQDFSRFCPSCCRLVGFQLCLWHICELIPSDIILQLLRRS
jgi:hypothetical protein